MTKAERTERKRSGKCIGGVSCEAPRVEGHERCRYHMRWNLKARKTARSGNEGKQITFNGQTLNQRQWAEKMQISEQSLVWRMQHWSLERALSTVGPLTDWHRSYTPQSERLLQISDGPRCGKCGLLEPHECTMEIEFYAIHQAQGTGEASMDFSRGRKGAAGRGR